MKRPFHTKPGHRYTPCPKCGNDREFCAHAERCAEDCCEVWVTCGRCGHDPTRETTGHRLEDVWGSLDAATIHGAMLCREDALAEMGLGEPPLDPDLARRAVERTREHFTPERIRGIIHEARAERGE